MCGLRMCPGGPPPVGSKQAHLPVRQRQQPREGLTFGRGACQGELAAAAPISAGVHAKCAALCEGDVVRVVIPVGSKGM